MTLRQRLQSRKLPYSLSLGARVLAAVRGFPQALHSTSEIARKNKRFSRAKLAR